MVGNGGIGKQSLTLSFVKDNCEINKNNHLKTLGLDNEDKTIVVDGKIIKLRIWN